MFGWNVICGDDETFGDDEVFWWDVICGDDETFGDDEDDWFENDDDGFDNDGGYVLVDGIVFRMMFQLWMMFLVIGLLMMMMLIDFGSVSNYLIEISL